MDGDSLLFFELYHEDIFQSGNTQKHLLFSLLRAHLKNISLSLSSRLVYIFAKSVVTSTSKCPRAKDKKKQNV